MNNSGSIRRPVAGALLALAVLAAVGARITPARAEKFEEYEVKAGFLGKLLPFIDWSSNSFAAANSPLLIGVLGEDPFPKTLNELLPPDCKGHPVTVLRSKRFTELKNCQMLFIARSEKSLLPQLLKELRGSSVLTISDLDRFARRGGMLGIFLQENHRVACEVNRTVMRRAGLDISSKVLAMPGFTVVESD